LLNKAGGASRQGRKTKGRAARFRSATFPV
jgi:hypothetical protein